MCCWSGKLKTPKRHSEINWPLVALCKAMVCILGHVFSWKTISINCRVSSWSHIHTVAIWTFTFHKISDFERIILKTNIKQLYRPIFWSENSDLLFSFSFYFLQNLSNPVLFTHCCCYLKELTYLNCDFCIKLQFN